MINWLCVWVCVAKKGWNQVCLDEKSKHIDLKKIEALNPLGANHPKMKKYLFSIFLMLMLDVFWSVLERSHAEVFLLNMHSCTHACMQKRSYKIC